MELTGNLIQSFAVAPVVAYAYDKPLESIIEYCNTLEFRKPPQGDSNYKSTDKWVLKHEALKDLRQFCLDSIHNYAANICDTDAKIGIQQSWVNLNVPGQQHPSHWHSNSYLSGVFYIASEQGSGSPLEIHSYMKNFAYNPTIREYKTEEEMSDIPYNPYTCSSCQLASIPGTLLVFSSMMPHSVPVNTTDKNRVSLSFNTFPELPLGDEERLNLIT
tara:strand:- start:296 stop:946 length:651 start_codon:yes stop_codon:yes gene_type:complete